MLNTTLEPIFVCKNEKVSTLIIKAAKLTEQIIMEREGLKFVSHNEAVKESARSGPKLTFIKYFRDIKDNKDLSKEWTNELYHLVNNRTASTYMTNIHKFFTHETQNLKRQRGKLESLRTELHLFFHNLWCVKAVILPAAYSRLPYEVIDSETLTNPENGKPKKVRSCLAEDRYPELLKIVRSPFSKKPYNQEFTDHMSNVSLNNIDWYAHRILRAWDAWDLSDLTKKHVEAFREISKEELGFAKTTSWLVALIDLYEDEIGFNSDGINQNFDAISTSLQNIPENWLSATEAKLNPHHMVWEGYFKEYAETLSESGYSTALKKPSLLRRIILEPLLKEKVPFPLISEYNREHLQISIKRQRKRVDNSTVNVYLRNTNDFFQWLQIANDDFTTPLCEKTDIPLMRRSQGTVKVLPPEGAYTVLLTYNYAICQWVEYINFHACPEKRKKIVLGTNKKSLINTEDSGFTPLYRVDEKYIPIREIPSVLISPIRVSDYIANNGSIKNHTLLPNTHNITALLMESGIRLMHCRWLDSEIYDKPSHRPMLNPKSYGMNKLHVNTDKSHGPWDATVSDTVIDILDSQKDFKEEYLRGKDTPTWYNGHYNSPFGKITPLFATPAPSLKQEDSFRVTSDNTMRMYFKALIRTFSFEMLQSEETQELAIVKNHDNLNLLDFADAKFIKIEVTPHSMRSQVVSDKIPFLPPNLIKEITGHVDEAHVIYYAQLKDKFIQANEKAQSDNFMNEIESAIINTQAKDSALQKALRGNNLGEVLASFGAISFNECDEKGGMKGGIQKLLDLQKKNPAKGGLSGLLYIDTTHICPFNNECPKEIIKRFESERKHCGECPYSIKTVDNNPAIKMMLRKYTDLLNDAKSIIDEAKKRKEPLVNVQHEIQEKKYYASEISAWTATSSLLSKMTVDLSKRDKWLVEKPEIISKRLSELEATNELTLALVKIQDAENSATYMTAQLKAQVAKLRRKLLISTKEYEKLLTEPEGSALLNEFKGIITSVCQLSGVSVTELGNKLEALPTSSALALEFN